MAGQRQGTGKHLHKSTRESSPPRNEQQSASGKKSQQASGGSSRQGGSGDEALKAREYRDKDGNIHHHTKAYMEQHKGEKGR